MEVLYILIIVAFVLLYLHITRNFNHWKNKNVDYMKPYPIFGNIYKICIMSESVGQFLHKIYNQYEKSPFVGFFAFDQPFLLIRDPELMKKILIKDFGYFSNRSIINNFDDDPVGSNLLFTMKNPTWKALRSKVSPAFSKNKLKCMLPLVVKSSENLVKYMKNIAHEKHSYDIREISMKYTTDVIASCAFGVNANCFIDKNAEFRKITHQVFHWNFMRTVETTSYFFAPLLANILKLKFIDESTAKFLNDMVTHTIMEREKSGSNRGDFLDLLIEFKHKFGFGNDKIIGTAAQLFLGGFETTGTTISYALYEMALNQRIQNKVRSEIHSVLSNFGEITYEALQDMKYLQMVINETLRKYPTLPFLDRRCDRDYQIPNTDVVIEKGIPIYISLLGLHYDGKYFADPHRFDPERFSPENKVNIPSCVYMPFGDGLRNCVGRTFGLISVQVALIQIIGSVKVDVNVDTPITQEFCKRGFLIAPLEDLKLKINPYK